MGRTLDEVIASLPIEQQERIKARTAEIIKLQQLRMQSGKTQTEVAQRMGVGQDTISRLERRGDMLLSTLRNYVESMGGELDLVVRLPGYPPQVIDPIGAASRQQEGNAAPQPTEPKRVAP